MFIFLQIVHTENHNQSTLISFLSYSVLQMSSYVAAHSPSLCVFQILWRPQTLLLLLLLPWIPPARQLIGSNNKLCSFNPLINVSPNWRYTRFPVCPLTWWRSPTSACIHLDKLILTHTWQCWLLDDSGTEINVIFFSTIQSHCHHLSVYPSGTGEMCEINSAFN